MIKIVLVLVLVATGWLLVQRSFRARAPMLPAEARRLLGVSSGAGAEEIREAHRRLISRVHPDAGGSAELATRVNAARDVLIAELNRTPPRAS